MLLKEEGREEDTEGFDDDYGLPKLTQSEFSKMIPMTMPMPMIRRCGKTDGIKNIDFLSDFDRTCIF